MTSGLHFSEIQKPKEKLTAIEATEAYINKIKNLFIAEYLFIPC
jgi:hypothetical protein